ncbi:MAG TPA: hypothetical protein VFA90_17420 [Terriglobales bacterium]|nr:hypothetical protein [Terriglobales bacterium]
MEKRARRITFDKTKTVILGTNQTGKSSLVKSIYYAIGAEPAKQHPRWTNADVSTLLKFSVDGQDFMVLRDSNVFLVFTGSGQFLGGHTSVTLGLGPQLAQLFDFKLVLPSREDTAKVPPPAFLYVPYYVDQDASWQNPWSGFSKLQQFTQWKTPVAEYHTGIRDNRFYELQAASLNLSRDLNVLAQKVSSLLGVIKTLEQDAKSIAFDFNPVAFEEHIGRLLRESELLLAQENKIKEELSYLNGQRALHQSRLEIAKRALGEISADLTFLNELPTDEIGCPTCGNEYTNDFAVRFAIAKDEDRVATFINQIQGDIARLDGEIADVYAKFRLSQTQANKIQGILAEKQNEVTLDMIIESEGRKSASNLLRDQLASAEQERAGIAAEQTEASQALKDHKVSLRTTQEKVMGEYRELLRRNLHQLEVNPLNEDAYSNIAPTIREIGSLLPRTLLAYYFAIWELAAAYSPSTVCPIVIDSPNQQAQDDHSLQVMLKFITERQPKDTQMILSVEKTMDVDIGGKLIELTDKYHLLQESEYASVKAEISPLLKTSVKG